MVPHLPALLLLVYVTPHVTPERSSQNDIHAAHNHPRTQSHTPPPRKFSTNPSPGTNMDKGLGMKKKKPEETQQSKKYPWDSSKTKGVILVPTDSMKKFEKPDEEGFRDDYYEEYDFEFAKGAIKNDNFEQKKNRDMAWRMERGS